MDFPFNSVSFFYECNLSISKSFDDRWFPKINFKMEPRLTLILSGDTLISVWIYFKKGNQIIPHLQNIIGHIEIYHQIFFLSNTFFNAKEFIPHFMKQKLRSMLITRH